LATKDFLLNFDEAYLLATSDNLEDQKHGGEIARKLAKEDISTLEGRKGDFGVEADDLVNLARQLIINHLILQAETYIREAELTEVTQKKIAYYDEASKAYEAADETFNADNFKIKEITLRESYDRDMNKADELFLIAKDGYNRAIEFQSGDFISKINAYVFARDAKINFQESNLYYLYHHETQKTVQVEEYLIEIEEILESLLFKLVIYFSLIVVILIIVSVYMIYRLKAWYRDTYDYFLGNEFVQVSESEI
jgi:hypothetical protein